MQILFVTNDYVGQQRAGPAIRAVELAKVLAEHHEVTLASAQPGSIEIDGIRFISGARNNPAELRVAAGQADVVIAQGLVLFLFPFLARARYLVIELYDPYLFEYLEHAHARFLSWGYRRQWYLLNQQLLRGDFFLCANERQWDYWLGRLCALGRLNPEQYHRDPTFRSLVDVLPFGVPATPPAHDRRVVKGVIPGIAENDILLIWGGGIWEWFDPLTLVRAMDLVARERSDIKLLFAATHHPDPRTPVMPVQKECQRLAAELGVLGRSVHFNEKWIPQTDFPNYLLEADIGVSAYWDNVETHFAFRTRVRDYIWAGLPMILTKGDSFASLVETQQLGRTVAERDVEGWRRAIIDLATNSIERAEIRQRLQQIARQFHWSVVARPLIRYCEDPYRTARMPGWTKQLTPLLSSGYQWLYRLAGRFQGS
jgi:glycosyltransferase involved in cell wall biosynthesis